MAIKKYTNGQVFYAEDMESLTLASNMRFPTAAARTATLTGTAAPAAGMLSTTTDDNATSRWTVQAGARWQPAASQVLFAYACTTPQGVGSGSWVSVTGWNSNLLGTRNVGAYFNPVTGVFKTDLAGWFELTGGVVFQSAYDQPRHCGFLLADPTTPAIIPYSISSSPAYASGAPHTFVAAVPTAVTLTPTASVTLAAYNSSGGAISICPAAEYTSYFSVRYLGGI